MLLWHHRLNGHESEQTLGETEGQEAWCVAVCEFTELDMTQQRNSRKNNGVFGCYFLNQPHRKKEGRKEKGQKRENERIKGRREVRGRERKKKVASIRVLTVIYTQEENIIFHMPRKGLFLDLVSAPLQSCFAKSQLAAHILVQRRLEMYKVIHDNLKKVHLL